MIRSLLPALATLLLGIALGWWLRPTPHATAPEPAATAERQVLYWYDPMHPGQHFDRPGRSPFMDMDLVPKYADEAGAGEAIAIDPRMAQNLGVRTARAELGRLAAPLRLTGAVAIDASASEVVSARTDGFLERVAARRPLASVHRGEVLAELVAPAWTAALAEYRTLLASPAARAAGLAEAARQRLAVLGVPAGAVQAVAAGGEPLRRIALVAPRDGILVGIEAREGATVAAGTPLFRIADLARVWVEVAVPEARSGALRAGLPATVSVPAWPGREFHGAVAAVLPEVDPATRTLALRIELDNPDAALAPGMYAEARLEPEAAATQVLVPSEAVIRSGTRNVVIEEEAPGRFLPREVRIGTEAEGRTAILEGLSAGARVVVSGQFLIDAEANLRGSLRRLEEPDPAHDMGSHDMGSHDMGSHDMGSHDMGSHDMGSHDMGSHDMGGHDMGSHDDGGAHQAGDHAAHQQATAGAQAAATPAPTQALPAQHDSHAGHANHAEHAAAGNAHAEHAAPATPAARKAPTPPPADAHEHHHPDGTGRRP